MQTYKVIGPRAVDGHQPGEKYEADYPAVKAAQLVAGGHIKVVAKEKDDLYEEAVAVGVTAPETMTQAELAEAIKQRTEPAKGGK